MTKHIQRVTLAFWVIGVGMFAFGIAPAAHAETLRVVTTTAYFADVAKRIGRERLDVKFIASPRFNVHYIQPKPSDVRNVSKADLFVHGGWDLELWVEPLLDAAGRPNLMRGREGNLDLSSGIELLQVPQGRLSRAEGDIHLFGNPHYTMNPENLRIIARSICDRLKRMDPAGSEDYETNTADFLAALDARLGRWRSQMAPCAGKEVIAYHDDIAYLADFAGIKAREFIEPKPGIPPTPKHMQYLEEYIRKEKIGAILSSTYYPKEAPQALARRTGVRVADIYQNAGEAVGTGDVLSLFDRNFDNLSEVLQ